MGELHITTKVIIIVNQSESVVIVIEFISNFLCSSCECSSFCDIRRPFDILTFTVRLRCLNDTMLALHIQYVV